MTPTGQGTETAEVQELRAQVRALQAEVAQLRTNKHRTDRTDDSGDSGAREIADGVRDAIDRGHKDADRLARGLVLGYLESVQIVAESADQFATRVRDLNRPRHGESLDDLVRRLPREVTTELLSAVTRAIDARRVVDRVSDSFDDTNDLPLSDERQSGKPFASGASAESTASAGRSSSV